METKISENEESEQNKKKNYQNKFLFEYLRNIIYDKSEETLNKHITDKDNIKSFPSTVILRYLSMSNDINTRIYVLKNQLLLERLDKLGHDRLYRFLFHNIPKHHSSFIKYIK